MSLNDCELSAVLYYADMLSLQHAHKSVTETTKYFYVHYSPMHISYILGQEPAYDHNNPWFLKALGEYEMLKDKYGIDGATSFVENMCNLGIAGSVNDTQMMKYLHRYDDKHDRAVAFKKFKENKQNRVFKHLTRNDDGEVIEEQCTKYVAHAEQRTKLNEGLTLPEGTIER